MSQYKMTKEAEEEKEHFKKVLQAFGNYKRDSKERLQRSHVHLKNIPLEHQKILAKHSHLQSLQQLDSCVELNSAIVADIILDAETMFENQNDDIVHDKSGDVKIRRTALVDVEKVHSTIKAIVRDWSEEGADERKMSYGPILERLETVFQGKRKQDIQILVPGAGVGRLAWEIAHRGFECQGNEFSLFMLLASNFVLNKCKSRNCFTIYPWIHQFTNNIQAEDMVRPAVFPDVNPNDLPETAKFSMAAGDFLEVYSAEEYEDHFDSVVTCFFIDCAHNIVEFIELIHKILKPGGTWINLGPLLYHFADVVREASIEPPYDVVRSVIQDVGFRFDEEQTDKIATYCQNPRSMLQFHYKCIYFSCTKL